MKRRIFSALFHSFGLLAVLATLGAQSAEYPAPAAVRADFLRLIARPQVPLEPRFTSDAAGGFVVETGSFATEAGKRVPALAVKSKAASGRRPAVIVLHGTGGHKEQMRAWLDDLASRGYVALALDARYHGAWIAGGAHGAQEYNEAVIAAWRSKPGEAREYPFWYDSTWDVLRAVDYLATRSDVDAARIGVLGVSMGGIEAYLAAAADPRIRAVTPLIATQSMRWSLENERWQGRARTIQQAHETAARDLGEAEVNARVARELWTKVVPGILDEFDGPSIVRLIAPRPLLVLSTARDQNCPLPGAELAFAQARAAYQAAGAADQLTIDVAPDAPHTVIPAHRRLANDWLDRQLQPQRGAPQGGE